MRKIKFAPVSVHMAFSTYPLGQASEYINSIKRIYSTYKGDMIDEMKGDLAKHTYKPSIYQLYGHYDILFLSLIESNRFALKVFDNTNDNLNLHKNISYKIQTGNPILLEDDKDCKAHEIVENQNPYLTLCSLKINNGILIGIGAFLYSSIIDLIKKTLSNDNKKQKISFTILNSYSWADITILLYGDDPEVLAQKIILIRELTIERLIDNNLEYIEKIKQASIFKNQFEVSQHIFTETQSILGVKYQVYQKNRKLFDNSKFSALIEWDVKPGHLSQLVTDLNAKQELVDYSVFRNGKTDLVTPILNNKLIDTGILGNIPSNYILAGDKLTTTIFQNEKKISSHLRKIKTIPIFKLSSNNLISDSQKHRNFNSFFLKYRIDKVPFVLEAVTALKLSRQLRMKIEKIFHLYNNSILDTISYVYIIDFKPFLEFFIKEIDNDYKKVQKCFNDDENDDTENLSNRNELSISRIESKYEGIINAFEEAYFDRVLNNYNYEDINDLNIDLNSNNTQVISTYDSIVKLLSPLLFDNEKRMLVRQNYLNTLSNLISINFNVFQLFEPHLIFNTIVKEICNHLLFNLERDNEIKSKFTNELEVLGKIRKQIRDEYINNNRDANENINSHDVILTNFDFLYFETDVLKYFYTFNSNSELYVFWSWLYFIQNSSLHKTEGTFINYKVVRELIRILLVLETFDPSYIDKMKCPFYELEDFWINYFYKIKNLVRTLTKLNRFKELVSALMTIYKDYTLIKEYHYNRALPFVNDHFDDVFSEKNKILNDKYNRNEWDKLKNINIDNKFKDRFQNRWIYLEVFSEIHKSEFSMGIPILYEGFNQNINPSLFFNCLSYLTLSWYYTQMKGRIFILPRDRVTGVVVKTKLKELDIFAYVDPQGGLFIIDPENRKIAMQFSSAVYHSLWHLALIEKESLFKNLDNND